MQDSFKTFFKTLAVFFKTDFAVFSGSTHIISAQNLKLLFQQRYILIHVSKPLIKEGQHYKQIHLL